jgi:drug/metabolite transporter (DMT)-like permease
MDQSSSQSTALDPAVRAQSFGWLDRGVLFGALAVLAFTFTVHSTRAAVLDFGGVITGLGRAEIAAVVAAAVLAIMRAPWPAPGQLFRLLLVGLASFAGFPYFLSLGLATVPSIHGVVVCGLVPMSTAAFSVLRGGERVNAIFWVGCLGGLAAVIAFAVVQGAGHILPGDGWIFAAVFAGSFGNVEGGNLAREMAGWRVVCWALVIVAPVLAVAIGLSLGDRPLSLIHPSFSAWLGLLYAGFVSSFLGFIAWFRGLALGGIARVAQVQLLQPAFGLVASAALLGERITPSSMLTAAVTAACAGICLSNRARPHRR